MVRGGSWNNNPQNLRSANRNRNTTDEANNNQGFRLASTPAIVPELAGSRTGRVCRGRPVADPPGCAGRAAKEMAKAGRRWRRRFAPGLPSLFLWVNQYLPAECAVRSFFGNRPVIRNGKCTGGKHYRQPIAGVDSQRARDPSQHPSQPTNGS
ncbi:MAG: hypothetical protein NTX45_29085 [Proteobacteria bacterium]|nr:hypothetical protein [Pseudomonadota bacterium]